jgi:hypothetical protein
MNIGRAQHNDLDLELYPLFSATRLHQCLTVSDASKVMTVAHARLQAAQQ